MTCHGEGAKAKYSSPPCSIRWLIRRYKCMCGPQHHLFHHLQSVLSPIPGKCVVLFCRKSARGGSEDHSLVRV